MFGPEVPKSPPAMSRLLCSSQAVCGFLRAVWTWKWEYGKMGVYRQDSPSYGPLKIPRYWWLCPGNEPMFRKRSDTKVTDLQESMGFYGSYKTQHTHWSGDLYNSCLFLLALEPKQTMWIHMVPWTGPRPVRRRQICWSSSHSSMFACVTCTSWIKTILLFRSTTSLVKIFIWVWINTY
jgi:hypothetical protein